MVATPPDPAPPGPRGPARRARGLVVPALLWLVAVSAAQIAGFELTIPWSHFQILDRPLLERHPFASLWLLHQQPPAFNALLALCLGLGEWLGTGPESVLKAIYLALGLMQVLLFTDLVQRVCGSRALGLVGAALLLADPAFHFYGNLGWYPFLERFGVVWFAWAALRTLESGRRAHLGLALGALALLTLTRTLFHPLWSLGAGFLLAALAWRRHPTLGPRASGPLLAGFVLVLALWPLKNALVFGRFTYSTITGINLIRVTQADQSEWTAFFGRGVVPPEVGAQAEAYRRRYGEELASLVTAARKSDGSVNWNHVITLHVGPLLAERANEWRRTHRAEWARIVLIQYFMWARPAFILSYRGTVRGPDQPTYQGYARAYERALFTDVRPTVEALTGEREFHRQARLRSVDRPLPYSLFGLLWFPVGIGAALLGQVLARGRRTAAGGLTWLALYALGWTLAIPILTDGIEGNRMRFATSALFTLLVLERGAALARRCARTPRP